MWVVIPLALSWTSTLVIAALSLRDIRVSPARTQFTSALFVLVMACTIVPTLLILLRLWVAKRRRQRHETIRTLEWSTSPILESGAIYAALNITLYVVYASKSNGYIILYNAITSAIPIILSAMLSPPIHPIARPTPRRIVAQEVIYSTHSSRTREAKSARYTANYPTSLPLAVTVSVERLDDSHATDSPTQEPKPSEML